MIMMLDLSMTRWELIQAFNKIARILFIDGYRNQEEALQKVKVLVIDVLTELQGNGHPVKFEVSDDKGE